MRTSFYTFASCWQGMKVCSMGGGRKVKPGKLFPAAACKLNFHQLRAHFLPSRGQFCHRFQIRRSCLSSCSKCWLYLPWTTARKHSDKRHVQLELRIRRQSSLITSFDFYGLKWIFKQEKIPTRMKESSRQTIYSTMVSRRENIWMGYKKTSMLIVPFLTSIFSE